MSLTIEEFGKQLITTGDLDPVYVAIDGVTMSQGAPVVIEKKTNVVSNSSISKDTISHSEPPPPVASTPSRASTPPREIEPSSQYKTDETPPPTADEPPAPSREGESQPGPAVSTVKRLPASMVSMPKIGSIDSIGKLIEEEEAILAQTVSKLSYENLLYSWKKYAETRESPSTKLALLNAQLDLEDTKVTARVWTELAIGFIQSEGGLSEFLRFDLNEARLTLEAKLDESLTPEDLKATNAVKRYLTPREKLKMMMEVNPLVKDLAVKLNLKPDE